MHRFEFFLPFVAKTHEIQLILWKLKMTADVSICDRAKMVSTTSNDANYGLFGV